MPAPTLVEWLWIVGIDGVVLACSGAIALALVRGSHRGFACFALLPLIPISLGFWALLAEIDEPACEPGAWFCTSPVSLHWIVWVLGWLVAAFIFTILGFLAFISWAGPAGWRCFRRSRLGASQ